MKNHVSRLNLFEPTDVFGFRQSENIFSEESDCVIQIEWWLLAWSVVTRQRNLTLLPDKQIHTDLN